MITRIEEQAHRATCPALPGCVGMGSTSDEAMDRFLIAAKGYLASMSNFVPVTLRAEQILAAS
jgi:predicted RNase H-like HicB family nuclease